MSDRELLELAAKAAGYMIAFEANNAWMSHPVRGWWNPLVDDGDLYTLAKTLGISIDFNDCCAWKRLPSGDLIQEFWGGECGDVAHAIVRAAAEIGGADVSEPKLLACPFCGGAAAQPEVEQIEHSGWMGRIECEDCDAVLSTQYSENSPSEAGSKVIAVWNTRAQPSVQGGE